MLLRLTRRYSSPALTSRLWKDATASSSFAYTVMTVSNLVRRSTPSTVLEETSLGPDSESLFSGKEIG